MRWSFRGGRETISVPNELFHTKKKSGRGLGVTRVLETYPEGAGLINEVESCKVANTSLLGP